MVLRAGLEPEQGTVVPGAGGGGITEMEARHREKEPVVRVAAGTKLHGSFERVDRPFPIAGPTPGHSQRIPVRAASRRQGGRGFGQRDGPTRIFGHRAMAGKEPRQAITQPVIAGHAFECTRIVGSEQTFERG